MSVKWSTNSAQQVYDDMVAESERALDDILCTWKDRLIPNFDEDIKTKIAAWTVHLDGLEKAAKAASRVDGVLIIALKPDQ